MFYDRGLDRLDDTGRAPRAALEERRTLHELGMLIVLSRRLVWVAASRRLEENGYSMLPFVLLGHLLRAGPATQIEIAAAVGQHPAGVSRLIDELQKEGMVRRRRDKSDRRRARVELTRKGRANVEVAKPIVMRAIGEALSPLTGEEQRRLQKLLLKLVSSADSQVCQPGMARAARAPRATKKSRSSSVQPRPASKV